jgi:NAD(P)H-hydrate epimerase
MNLQVDDISAVTKSNAVVIHVKDRTDRIACGGGVTEVSGGNAGLTVGGTGDALAGLIAGLIAQGMPPAEASVAGSRVVKRAGTLLYEKNGFAYATRDVIGLIAHLLHTLE